MRAHSLHRDTIGELRQRQPRGTAGIPDEALERTASAAWVSFELSLRDLARAVFAALRRRTQ